MTATFNSLALSLPDFKVSAGSVTLTSNFALSVGIQNGSLQWQAVAPGTPPAASGIVVTVPDTVRLDKSGLYLGGAASAALNFAGQSYPGALHGLRQRVHRSASDPSR